MLPPTTSSVRVAREFARRILESTDVERAEDVMLAASELVTNAVVHAQTDLELAIDTSPDTVRLEVTDGTMQPAVRQQPVPAEGGLGLLIVETLSERWGSDSIDGTGKRVWCEIRSRESRRQREHQQPAERSRPVR